MLKGYTDLVVLRNSLRTTETEAVRAEGLSSRAIEEKERLQQQLAEADKTTISKRDAIEKLKSDLKAIEENERRLKAGTPSPGTPGNRVKGFVGTGDRQYLSGLKLGGEHIVILVDASASMLDDTVVNVIRLRNMPESRRLLSTKWRRTVATVDWLTAQIPGKSKFQVIGVQYEGVGAGAEHGRPVDRRQRCEVVERSRREPAPHGTAGRHQPRKRVHGDRMRCRLRRTMSSSSPMACRHRERRRPPSARRSTARVA